MKIDVTAQLLSKISELLQNYYDAGNPIDFILEIRSDIVGVPLITYKHQFRLKPNKE